MAMLDLNVEINHMDSDSTCAQKELQLQRFPFEISYSKTSNSLIWNPTEEDSTNNSSPFIFDILKKENEGSEIVTKTLFPVTTDKGGRMCDFKIGLWEKKNQWLNLSFPEPDEQNGMRNLKQKVPQVRKSRRGPRSRSSQYRGVTFYRRTGRWESHIWDCGKQVYLGGFDTAQAAARAYDRAAIKFRGVDADINFSLSDYEEDLNQMKGLSKQEFVLLLRRQVNGISKRCSTYRAGLPLQKYESPRIAPFVSKTFYQKPPFRSDIGEVETYFKPCSYKGTIIANSNKEGTCRNLDLSLGISPSSKQLKISDSGGGFSFGSRFHEIPNNEKGKMEKEMVERTKDVPLQSYSNLVTGIEME